MVRIAGLAGVGANGGVDAATDCPGTFRGRGMFRARPGGGRGGLAGVAASLGTGGATGPGRGRPSMVRFAFSL